MRTSKIVTISTFVITILSLILTIVCNLFCTNKLFYDVFLTIFGSGFLAFIMSYIEYAGKKRNVMELYYQEGIRIRNLYGKLSPALSDVPSYLLTKYLVSKKYGNTKDVIKEIEDYFINNYDLSYPIDELDNMSKNYEDESINEIDRYLDVCNYDITNFGNLFADFRTIMDKESEDLCKRIYKLVVDSRKKIYKEKYHFVLMKRNNGNKYVCIDKVKKLDDYHTTTNIEVKEKELVLTITPTFLLELDKLLEEFRCRIYGEKFIDNDFSDDNKWILYKNYNRK